MTPFATVRACVAHRDLLLNLTQRELRGRYRRTALGWPWTLLNPALTAAVYSFVFVFIFKVRPEPGDPSGNENFTFFLLAGMLPWNFFAVGVTAGVNAVIHNVSLITRVYLPRELIPTSAVAAMGITLCLELAVLVVIELAAGYTVVQFVPAVLLLVLLQALLVLGVAYWLSALNVRYRDVQHLLGVLLMIWFYLTPVIYDLSLIRKEAHIGSVTIPVRMLLHANPMAPFVASYRACLYDGRLPSPGMVLAAAAWGVAAFVVGSAYFRRRARRFAEEL